MYDADLHPTGITIVRGEPIPAGCYHIVVHVLTVNSGGRILVTKRAPEITQGGWWEVTGGSKVAGETPEQAACRELYEETGISVTEDMLTHIRTDRDGQWFHIRYLVHTDAPASGIRLQPGETVDYRWVTPQEFYALMDENDPSGDARQKAAARYGSAIAEIRNGKDDSE